MLNWNIYFNLLYSILLITLEKCLWNDFSAWSECDKDCGGGSQHRARTVYQEAKFGGEPCEGDAEEERVCNENPCAGSIFLVDSLSKILGNNCKYLGKTFVIIETIF